MELKIERNKIRNVIEIECLAGTEQNEVFSSAYMAQASLPYSVL